MLAAGNRLLARSAAPNMLAVVDIVYTWVDGRSAGYPDQLTRHAEGPRDLNRERYGDELELLRYSLRSLHKHLRCPYRYIHIVTQRPQVPAWLDLGHPRIRLVHHDQIFENPEHLPTFSSNAIELSLHRIPELADRFVYLNDDFILGREVDERDLCDDRGGPRYAPGDDANAHIPHLIVREHIERMIAWRPEVFAELLRQRFRRSSYYPLDEGYKDFLIAQGEGSAFPPRFVPRHRLVWRIGENAETDWAPLDAFIEATLGTNIGRSRLWLWLTRAVLTYCRWSRPKFICLNDDLGATPDPRHLDLVRRHLDKSFPVPSPYERRQERGGDAHTR